MSMNVGGNVSMMDPQASNIEIDEDWGDFSGDSAGQGDGTAAISNEPASLFDKTSATPAEDDDWGDFSTSDEITKSDVKSSEILCPSENVESQASVSQSSEANGTNEWDDCDAVLANTADDAPVAQGDLNGGHADVTIVSSEELESSPVSNDIAEATLTEKTDAEQSCEALVGNAANDVTTDTIAVDASAADEVCALVDEDVESHISQAEGSIAVEAMTIREASSVKHQISSDEADSTPVATDVNNAVSDVFPVKESELASGVVSPNIDDDDWGDFGTSDVPGHDAPVGEKNDQDEVIPVEENVSIKQEESELAVADITNDRIISADQISSTQDITTLDQDIAAAIDEESPSATNDASLTAHEITEDDHINRSDDEVAVEDDFGDFDSPRVAASSVAAESDQPFASSLENTNAMEDDDFGDFDSPAAAADNTAANKSISSADDFSSMKSEAAITTDIQSLGDVNVEKVTAMASEENEDWGDFDESQATSSTVAEIPNDHVTSTDQISSTQDITTLDQDIAAAIDEESPSATNDASLTAHEITEDDHINRSDDEVAVEDDFGDFDSPRVAASSVAAESDQPFASSLENTNAMEDDDFGDFDSPAAAVPSVEVTQADADMTLHDHNDDWGDFDAPEVAVHTDVSSTPQTDDIGSALAADTPSVAVEDNDWGDFDAAPASSTVEVTVATAAADDDEWGDFDAPSSTPAGTDVEPPSASSLENANATENDDFGDFDSAPAAETSVPALTPVEDDDDWGDFGESTAPTVSDEGSTSLASESVDISASLRKLAPALSTDVYERIARRRKEVADAFGVHFRAPTTYKLFDRNALFANVSSDEESIDAVANLIMSTIPADAIDIVQKEPLFKSYKHNGNESQQNSVVSPNREVGSPESHRTDEQHAPAVVHDGPIEPTALDFDFLSAVTSTAAMVTDTVMDDFASIFSTSAPTTSPLPNSYASEAVLRSSSYDDAASRLSPQALKFLKSLPDYSYMLSPPGMIEGRE